MSPSWQVDDDIVEAIVSDEPVDDTFTPLVAFARSVRAAGEQTVPRASRELADLLEGIRQTGPRPVVVPPATKGPTTIGRSRLSKRRHRVPVGIAALAGKVASLSLAGKAAAGTAAVAIGGLAAGVTGVAPAPITDPVQSAVSTVTPLDLGDTEDTNANVDAGNTASVGAGADADNGADAGVNANPNDVAGTATGAVGDVAGTATGVAGNVAGEATGVAGGVADEALDIPNETPVGEVVPDDLPDLPVDTTLPQLPELPGTPDAEAGAGANASR